MEQVRLSGSTIIEAEVVDRYESKETGNVYAIALIEGERVPVVRYPDKAWCYLDVAEIVDRWLVQLAQQAEGTREKMS